MSKPQTRRWYAEPWVWLIIALPLSAVIGGMITLWLAIRSNDGLVVDDYYERGKEINLDLARDKAALQHGMTATVQLDVAGNAVNIRLAMTGNNWPDRIRFSLLHPTRAGHDVVIDLLHAGSGEYHGSLPAPTAGHWYVQLEADDWRLSGTLLVPQSTALVLVPAK
jgi:hypothetical protein